MACKWITDVEGSAYNRSAADGKKCNLVLQTQDMFPKLSARVVMLTQFPVGFSNTCSSSEIETVISASLFLQEYNTELCWREGTSTPEEGLVALLVFWVMDLFFPSQEIWTGTLSHRARNLNVVAEVTLP